MVVVRHGDDFHGNLWAWKLSSDCHDVPIAIVWTTEGLLDNRMFTEQPH